MRFPFYLGTHHPSVNNSLEIGPIRNTTPGTATQNVSVNAPLETPAAWVPNDIVDSCMGCEKKFVTLFRLKHHCRACGNIYCDDCSSAREYLPPFYTKEKVRVCMPCSKKAQLERQKRRRLTLPLPLSRAFTETLETEEGPGRLSLREGR